MRFFLYVFFAAVAGSYCLGQSLSQQAIDTIHFLEHKLNYTYRDPDDGTWWVNRFYFDEPVRRAHFRTSSAENPLKMLGKRRVDRSFSFADLDPYGITVEKTEINMGLVVEGNLISIPTVKSHKLVSKQLDGQSETPQSVLLISVPAELDSADLFTTAVVEAFKLVILESTNLYRETEPLANKQTVFETLLGDHVSDKSNRYTIQKSMNELRFYEYLDKRKIQDGVFGYDSDTGRFYEQVERESGHTATYEYEIDPTREDLVLRGLGEHSNRSLEITNKSMYLIKINDHYQVFRPVNSTRFKDSSPRSR